MYCIFVKLLFLIVLSGGIGSTDMDLPVRTIRFNQSMKDVVNLDRVTIIQKELLLKINYLRMFHAIIFINVTNMYSIMKGKTSTIVFGN